MSSLASTTEEEQERRMALLLTGRFSDLLVKTGYGNFELHAALVGLRCDYIWRQMDPKWMHSQTLDIQIPAAFEDTDGPFTHADLIALWKWVYTTEAAVAAQWQGAAGKLVSAPESLTESEVKRWLRLHRLARFFDAPELAAGIEHFIVTAWLPAWTRLLVQSVVAAERFATPAEEIDDALRALLLPRLECLLSACHADPEGRWFIGRATVAWALSLGASLFPDAGALRIDLANALRDSPFSTGSMLSRLGTVISVVCDDCFKCMNAAPDSRECTRLPSSRDWFAVRTRGGEHSASRLSSLTCVSASAFPAVEFQHFDVTRQHATPVLTLTRQRAAGPTAWYDVPLDKAPQSLLSPACVGRCQHPNCRAFSAQVHVFAMRPLIAQPAAV
jgi:hypothetical protein